MFISLYVFKGNSLDITAPDQYTTSERLPNESLRGK